MFYRIALGMLAGTLVLGGVGCSESTEDSGSGGSGAQGGSAGQGGSGAQGGSAGSSQGGSGAQGGSAGAGAQGGSAGQGGTGGGQGGSGGSSSSGVDFPDATMCGLTNAATVSVVINEMSADDEWIELYNPGSVTVSLSGLTVADLGDDGCPDASEGITFGSGAEIPPGGFLLLLGDQTPSPDLQTTCIGNVAACYHVGFKLSASKGDAGFLLNGTEVIAYTGFGADAIPDGDTYGRIPDGTGPFTLTQPTPGEANVAVTQ